MDDNLPLVCLADLNLFALLGFDIVQQCSMLLECIEKNVSKKQISSGIIFRSCDTLVAQVEVRS